MDVWQSRLLEPVLVRLGATATAAELLEPLASNDGFWEHMMLAATMYQAGRFEDTLRHSITAFRIYFENSEEQGDDDIGLGDFYSVWALTYFPRGGAQVIPQVLAVSLV
jgi:hypothetical protein